MRYSIWFMVLVAMLAPFSATAQRSKDAYVERVVRGGGLMSWQDAGDSVKEEEFRAWIENRKDAMLANRGAVQHPALLDAESMARARRNIDSTEWGKKWYQRQVEHAEGLVAMPASSVIEMIPELSPTNAYGFTCPKCVGRLSQEAMGHPLFSWTVTKPDIITCKRCNQTYPDEKFPETWTLQAPRMGQAFTFYANEAQRAEPDDRTGELAWHWVGHPIHVSFSGIVRQEKVRYMLGNVNTLAYAYAFTNDPKYAKRAILILERLAQCYRNWLYRDYWDTVADCDPMYAAWHDRELPIEWKRHLATGVFEKDKLDAARMEQTYWGAGRYHPSTDGVSQIPRLCEAYDLLHDATDSDGVSLWKSETRMRVERDLILEWVMGAEAYVGGAGKADSVNNKAPRIYYAMAAIARTLGIPDFADVAYRGYQGLRDESFLYDGFSKETPAYTNMYLAQLIGLTETLHGFQWPVGYQKHTGVLELYGKDARLDLMLRAVVDQLRHDGRYMPLGDTRHTSRPSAGIVEAGIRRYPEHFVGRYQAITGRAQPSTYAVFNLEAEKFAELRALPAEEILYPAWMTAILRHGTGTHLSLAFNPAGGHRHRDNLSLYYVDRGHTVLGDHGYVGDMPVNAWIKSTESHNLVVVDDATQLFDERKPALHFMATTPECSVVEASSQAYRQCMEYRRRVVLVKGPEGQSFAVDLFWVRGGNKHAYRMYSELAASDATDGSLLSEELGFGSEQALPEVGNSLKQADIYGVRDVEQIDAPPQAWSATWRQTDRAHRVWMLSQVDAVERGNGPGQRSLQEAGRRVRYLDAIREGEDVESLFVAVHEPSGTDGGFAVENAELVAVDGAVVVRIESAWGQYLILNDAETTVEVNDVRFDGTFALVRKLTSQKARFVSLGTRTLEGPGLDGFRDAPAIWEGAVEKSTGQRLDVSVSKPAGWPEVVVDANNYAVIHDGEHWTGFPISSCRADSINVNRFSLPEAERFKILALRYEN